MTDAVLSFRPTPEQLCYSFGGRDPLACIRPGQLLEVGTEDCFGGLVRTADDRPSVVCQLPFVNPVTGPSSLKTRNQATRWPSILSPSLRRGTGQCRRRSGTSGR